MQQPLEILQSVFGIALLRRSPERLQPTQTLLFTAIALAMCASAAVEIVYWRQDWVQALLRVFSEFVVLAVGLVWLTRKISRYKFGKMIPALLLISAFGDVAIIVLGSLVTLVPLIPATWSVVIPIALVQLYGATNVMQFGLGGSWMAAALYPLAYAGITLLLWSTLARLFVAAVG